MAQKAKKDLANRNASKLNIALYGTLGVHMFYTTFRILLFRQSTGYKSLLIYVLLSAPALLIQLWFESIGRPKFADDNPYELKRAGEDLDAKGLTEFLWDILYWTWGCVVFAGAFGDRCWWLWMVVPGYAVYMAWTTYTGVKGGMAGFAGQGEEGMGQGSGVQSKRQAKLEKRGQRVRA